MNKDKLRKEYYKSNLDKLGEIHCEDSIKIIFNNKETSLFALNYHSIRALKKWLDIIEVNI